MATHYLHKIRLTGNKSKYSAYYEADHICGIESALSRIVDAERIDSLGRSFPCSDAEMERLWHFRHHAEPYRKEGTQ